ncbi:MAG TPA: VWA domain-containing protein [Longimicrobiales bacterium]|nr:VWA domain-containing protein [Longimicrobiales bacterium]
MSVGFANPWALLLLLGIPLYVWLTRREQPRSLTFSRAGLLGRVAPRSAQWLARVPGWLRALAVTALIVAIATPRTGAAVVDIDAEGIAIAVVVDISSSMLAEDLSVEDEEGRSNTRNRLAVAKETVAEFVRGRQYDRIGLVAFAGEALTQVPITIDYPVIYQALDQLSAGTGMLEDGTAIGTAIATAANRLRRAPGESRVMILMTDGENNRGDIDPLTAAQAAAAFDIRIYTIGVGSDGVAPIPIATGPFGVQYANLPVHIDEDLLREIAATSGGQYFRATNEEALDSIYGRIDQLERTDVEVRRYVNYTPHYLPLIAFAMLALITEWSLRASRFGRVP